MAKIIFSDIGEVELDELKCYQNVARSGVAVAFVGEVAEISSAEDEIKLFFKGDSTKTTQDLNGILELETQVPLC